MSPYQLKMYEQHIDDIAKPRNKILAIQRLDEPDLVSYLIRAQNDKGMPVTMRFGMSYSTSLQISLDEVIQIAQGYLEGADVFVGDEILQHALIEAEEIAFTPVLSLNQAVDVLPGLSTMAICPVCHEETSLKLVIISLNDIHQWSRDAIADWLETLDTDLTFRASTDQLTIGETDD